jgi:hypothetical protein
MTRRVQAHEGTKKHKENRIFYPFGQTKTLTKEQDTKKPKET